MPFRGLQIDSTRPLQERCGTHRRGRFMDVDELPRTQRSATSEEVIHIAIRLALLAGLIYWSFVLLSPFIPILLWSAVLAVALYPVYDWLTVHLGNRPR